MQILNSEQWVVNKKEKNTNKKAKEKKNPRNHFTKKKKTNRRKIKIFQCAKEEWLQNKTQLFAYFIPKVLATSTHVLMRFPGKIYLHNNTSNRLHGASWTPFPVTGTTKIRNLDK